MTDISSNGVKGITVMAIPLSESGQGNRPLHCGSGALSQFATGEPLGLGFVPHAPARLLVMW